jgi:hypothetical protein
MKKRLSVAFVLLLFIPVGMLLAQTSGYNPRKAFDPLFDSQPGTAYRSADGQPGPAYWTNRADYHIEAALDTLSKTITASEYLTYTNNSPDSLWFLWLQLDQNRFAKNSRSAAVYSQQFNPKRFIGGYHIRSVEVKQNGKYVPAKYIITDTRMQIRLAQALHPKGGVIRILIRYYFVLPPAGNGRAAWMRYKQGTIYEVAGWYPRMAVYDDLTGWNVLPFLGSEFYLDYGDFDIYLTVPADQIVASSGKLKNAEEVLSPIQIKRLKKAETSDQTIAIRTAAEVAHDRAHPSKKGIKIWHFTMHNSRDFTWAASSTFLWDAAKVNLPNHKTTLAMAFYPEESAGKEAWNRALEFLKGSVEIFSKHWFTYPYPTVTVVGGPVGGMEYPGLAFCHWRARNGSLWMVINHEVGHNWFPMIVGSSERKNAWMDEGMNTFIDIYATADFNHGEFAPKSDHEYNPQGGSPGRGIVPLMLDKNAPPILTWADAFPHKYTHPVSYYKTSLGLVLLREYILGPDRFDYAFRTYIRRWAYKHPSPTDFFRTINNAAGENLNWFWKGWFVNNWTLDQAVTSVKYVHDDPAQGALVILENLDQLVMPVTLKITEETGDTLRVKLPVEIWEKSGTYTLRLNTTAPLKKVIVDPDKMLPDVNPKNNIWPAGKL